MVVGDLGVVENTAIEVHPTRLKGFASMCGEVVDLEFPHHIFHIGEVVVRHVAGVGTRIGEDFVFFVERLSDLECALGTQAETRVRLALQCREIVKLRRNLRGGLFFLGNNARLASAFGDDCLGGRALPEALGLGVLIGAFFEFFVKPAPAINSRSNAKISENLKIGTRLKSADFFFPHGQDRQRGRLHSTDWRKLESAPLRVEGGHGARGIDAYQPIAFATAHGGIGERNHLLAGTQVGEPLADGLGRHAL